MFPNHRTLARRLAPALLVSLLLWAVIVAGASRALAHHGDLTSSPVCTADAWTVTWSQGWENVPRGVTGVVRSRTGTGPWVERGTTTGTSGRIAWDVTYPGDTVIGPWEYVEIRFGNGHRIDSQRRVEGLTPCVKPEPTPEPTPTPEPEPSPTPTPEPSPEPSPSPTPSPSPEPTPDPTPTSTPTPGPTPSPEPTPSDKPTPSPEPSSDPTPPAPEDPPSADPEPSPDPTPGPDDDPAVPELPETGSNLALAVLTVLGLLGVGAAMVTAARRKNAGER